MTAPTPSVSANTPVPLHEELRIEAALWSQVPYIGKLSVRLNRMAGEAERLQRELAEARATNRELHRRTQMAEAAIPSYQRLIALPPDGDGVRLASGNFGRALLTWYCEQLTERAESAESALAADPCVRHSCKRVRLEMQAQIDAARRDAERNSAIAEASEWREIESAPKDGTHVWLGNASNLRIAFWHYPADGWIDHSLAENGSQRTVHFTPTHWMPLPKPPTVRLVRVEGE